MLYTQKNCLSIEFALNLLYVFKSAICILFHHSIALILEAPLNDPILLER